MNRLICAALAAGAVLTGAAVAKANDTGFATSHDLRREGGHTCFADHTHGGSAEGGTKVVAFTAAMKIWYDTTAGEYGSDWANWGKSASKKVSYAKASDVWSATIESRPCR